MVLNLTNPRSHYEVTRLLHRGGQARVLGKASRNGRAGSRLPGRAVQEERMSDWRRRHAAC